MIETYKEFVFEAAHQVPPHSTLHGHTFKVGVVFRGEPDPIYGWAENLDRVEADIETLRKRIDHSYLNDIDGLECPSLENVARWVWRHLEKDYPTLATVSVTRGSAGNAEGCTYYGETYRQATQVAA